jgi:class 3 adenylate cyclase
METVSQKLLDSIEVFNKLGNKTTRLSVVDYQECDSYTMIEIQRDVETLIGEEIALIVALFRHSLEKSLVADEGESLYGEDLQIQEEIIEHMLESVKGYAGDKKLFAFREEGRVLVFNK